MQIIDDIVIFGEPIDEGALNQIKNCQKEASMVALMADHHKGYNMPVGGVAAYENKISPAGVGFDIACGCKAVKLNLKKGDIFRSFQKVEAIAADIFNNLSFGVGRTNDQEIDHPLFEKSLWDELELYESGDIKARAREQLGTIGSGNHYVDVLVDEATDELWIAVHFGSRGLGYKTAEWFIRSIGSNPNGNPDEPPVLLDVKSDLGEQYIKAMALAGEYAYAGRDWVCRRVSEILGGYIEKEVHNHHNFAWLEPHNGSHYWVVRKGATPNWPGMESFVGGSMGTPSYILEGIESAEGSKALHSTVHGAGRVMSRTQAAGKWKRKKGRKIELITPGIVDMPKVKEELVSKEICLIGGGADEAPEVYKDIENVIDNHKATFNVKHVLRPVIVLMASSDEFDPYKD